MPVSPNAPHEQIISNAAAQAMGKTWKPQIIAGGGGLVEAYDISYSGALFCAIQCLSDCIFSRIDWMDEGKVTQQTQTDNTATDIDLITFPAGTYFTGNINGFVLDSGNVIAYVG